MLVSPPATRSAHHGIHVTHDMVQGYYIVLIVLASRSQFLLVEKVCWLAIQLSKNVDIHEVLRRILYTLLFVLYQLC